jgi:hypothetical protein
MFGARIKQSLLAVVVTTATVAGSATFFGSPVQAATPDSGTANAYGLHVALFGGNIVAAEPDAVLPANGSPVTLTQTLPVNVPGLISANTLNASVSSTNFGTAAETINAAAGAEGISGGGSTLLGVSALNLLNVGAVQSNCTSSASGSTGGTSIANLTIGNGTPINLPNDTTAPNTGLTAAELGPLAGVVTIVLNKQVTSDTHANPPTSGSTSIQVIGMEITLLGGVDAGAVIDIAQSFCQATGPDHQRKRLPLQFHGRLRLRCRPSGQRDLRQPEPVDGRQPSPDRHDHQLDRRGIGFGDLRQRDNHSERQQQLHL